MKNSNSPIELATALTKIESTQPQSEPGKICSTSTYGTVSKFSNNTIQIIAPFHFSGTGKANVSDIGVSKLILSNIESEFKELRKHHATNRIVLA